MKLRKIYTMMAGAAIWQPVRRMTLDSVTLNTRATN